MVNLSDEQISELFGILSKSPTDAVKLAFLPPETPPETLDGMDFTGLSSFKRTGSGVEIKLIDRLGALTVLTDLQREAPDGSFDRLLGMMAPDDDVCEEEY